MHSWFFQRPYLSLVACKKQVNKTQTPATLGEWECVYVRETEGRKCVAQELGQQLQEHIWKKEGRRVAEKGTRSVMSKGTPPFPGQLLGRGLATLSLPVLCWWSRTCWRCGWPLGSRRRFWLPSGWCRRASGTRGAGSTQAAPARTAGPAVPGSSSSGSPSPWPRRFAASLARSLARSAH